MFPGELYYADGQPMTGVTHGLFLEFLLPIWRHGRLINARTCSLFAYEANIQGVDVIMGYPFLKVFNLLVDAQHDRLVVCPDDIQEAPIPSQEIEASVTMPTSQVTVTYEVSSDVEVRTMFGCTCSGDFDPKCPLAPYHGMEGGMANVEPPVVTQDFEVEQDSNMVHFNDDWQYVAINRTEVVSPLSIEAKQALRQGSFEVIPSMFKRILEHVPVDPHVDAFASKANAKLPTYWTIHQDAFKQD